MMTQMWEFELPDGEKMYLNLQWKYVPFIEELRAWVLANWDKQSEFEDRFGPILTWSDVEPESKPMGRGNMERFYEYADELVESVARPKHPIGWVLDKVNEHLDSPDDDDDDDDWDYDDEE